MNYIPTHLVLDQDPFSGLLNYEDRPKQEKAVRFASVDLFKVFWIGLKKEGT